MSTEAQIKANQLNAQHSTGPTSPAGKAEASRNHHLHGLTGVFRVLESENPRNFQALLFSLREDHNPTTDTEALLVERMAQHHWLRFRAIQLQTEALESTERRQRDIERSLALYIRYQTTNERAFQNCLNDLLKLRAEKRKEEIGFESQKRAEQEQTRKQSVETRKQELHKFQVWHAEGKAEHQQLLNAKLETPEMKVPNRLERLITRQQAA